MTSLPENAGVVLLRLARATIASALGRPADLDAPLPAWTGDRGATFVTLHLDGRLRGCIGTLEAYRPLADDVRANAVAAALHDPRFPSLSPGELDRCVIEISVLSSPEPMDVTSEESLVRGLRPHVDGVLLEAPGHRGTYLPQVWEQLPEPSRFVRSLKAKAGLPHDYWSDEMRFSRYTVTSWEES